jgi:hypothetical protein
MEVQDQVHTRSIVRDQACNYVRMSTLYITLVITICDNGRIGPVNWKSTPAWMNIVSHFCKLLSPEIDCNKTAMGLPPVTSAVFLIAN